ncbi:glucan 1,3-alpha-glucosidase ROT2 [Sugiyamaella lignohabitans]|uniref:Glucosidase II subunit alpha n=1 Tax=Sugiyamaella lignohabitans TaxID=796027 RepID=A0A167FIM1_9ASCO|nr:glucan 1,3-alpha-glucosidase ROT2 [Sugiyamaella lignohabitans]ANB15348.1 glucan 1,3-alpha-glucosidase ROT2 [Sugiyamaella lignohabitans]
MQRMKLFLILAAVLFGQTIAVKEYLFRTCDQNPFCKRNRYYADRVDEQDHGIWKSPYRLDLPSVVVEGKAGSGTIIGTVLKTVEAANVEVELPLTVSFLESSKSVRISIDERLRRDGNIDVFGDGLARPERYNITEWALIDGALEPLQNVLEVEELANGISIQYGESNRLEIQADPLKFTFYRAGSPSVVLNEKGYLNYEHWRPIEDTEVQEVGGDSQDVLELKRNKHMSDLELDEGLWEDTFDSKKDIKSRGPEAIALDATFPGFSHVYGIPEHADSMSLRETRGDKKQVDGEIIHSNPYRLYNVDIFEYETNSPMAMYGSIPFIQAHKQDQSVGVFWANAADTYVDITKDKKSTTTHWISEAGLLDVFVILGDSPAEISTLYSKLTGTVSMPQSFAIGYHQCRWNYNTQEDVLDVNEKMDEHDIPYDVIWLDIEYTMEKKYFTWNEALFPDHVSMMSDLDKTKRKLVAIIDPHIKVADNYDVVKTLKSELLAVKNSKGELFYGHCWPGESVWIDTLSPMARSYWTSLFASGTSFGGDSQNLHIWNDMNEPSVFSGPESSMPKDNIHYGSWEHRDVHNLVGLTFHNATVDAMAKRYNFEQRPFVLTRSYFAGSQRIGPMWTGDNMAKWEYLEQATPMLLTSGIAGMPFCGADVGGFFGNPSSELLTRWYQAGAFYPFFRGHAHIDAKRREPYIPPPPYNTTISNAIKLRYRLLPTFYTAFYESSIDGSPILKPTFYVTPSNEKTYAIDDQFFVGNSGILVKPVTKESATSVDVYLPDNEVYYDFDNFAVTYSGEGYHSIDTPLEKIPVLLRGGHIHARRERPRRSATLMKNDPYTIVIALDKNGDAEGKLYLDDGESYDYQKGEFVLQTIKYSSKERTITGQPTAESSSKLYPFSSLPIEKIVIIHSSEAAPVVADSLVTINEGSKSWTAEVQQSDSVSVTTIRNPRMSVGGHWSVVL